MQIHQRIKKERLKQKLSEEEVANRLEIKRSTYQYWETTTPSIEKIKAVAKALGFEENYFFVTTENDDENNGNRSDENLSNKSGIEHNTQVAGTVLHGQVVLVEAKDLTASYERLIEEKERIIKIIEAHAAKAEKEKDRLLTIIEKQLTDLKSNSEEMAEDIEALTTEIQAEHRAMMDSIDVAAGQPIGTTFAKSDTVEIASERGHLNKDKTTGIDKKAESGKKD